MVESSDPPLFLKYNVICRGLANKGEDNLVGVDANYLGLQEWNPFMSLI